jgi:formylglycine-generating enzyme required for sulfatase activity
MSDAPPRGKRAQAPPPPPPPPPRARLTPLPPVFPHAWAAAYGEDRHGLWQAFEVAGVRQVLRWVPPGRFLMGSPPDEPKRWGNETQHAVVLTEGFWLADTACTQALWMAVMDGANPSDFKDDTDNPVETVSWNDVANDFLPRLNTQVPGLAALLPTEAQWEYACRGDAARNTPFWFGGLIASDQVNFDGTEPMPGGPKSAYRQHTVPVKALPCNGWGLHQMHGNVWEWCADWYAAYTEGEVENPAGPSKAPSETAGRVQRGGSWFNFARFCRSAQRDIDVPGKRSHFIGFRLARAAS